jgi:peptidoglycan-associated lipoprotein
MTRSVAAVLACVGLLFGVNAAAQTQSSAPAAAPAQPQTPATSTSTTRTTRPETLTFMGDSGLWYVPTADVLARGKWSVSGYRASANYREGFTNIGSFGATFGVGVTDRVEIFGAMDLVRRIDRDLRPLFIDNPDVGGAVHVAPFMTTTWSGNQVGDLYLGAKVNLLSEEHQAPASVALRGIVKVPTASRDDGVGTGQIDFNADAVVSKELHRLVELSGYGGGVFRRDPSGVTLPNGFEWGFGADFPSRSPLRAVAEVRGEVPFSDAITFTTPLVAVDGSLSPLTSTWPKQTTTTVGVVWQASNGFFIGGGMNWNVPMADRTGFQTDSAIGQARDFVDYQIRVGFHPGVGIYVPPAPPPPPPPPTPANRPPTVEATCNPCTVNVGESATVTAQAQDPDGDTLRYQWRAQSGTLAEPTAQRSPWTAPNQEGAVPITVTVDDGKGGTASATTTIQVVRPKKTYTFEDVHFDFDQYSLRPAATRMLDEVVQAMQSDPTLKVQIEGHTDNIGTSEYNLALGDRRAKSVQQYLISRGIDASRLTTISYGEEDPKYSNDREETRRLNRRAALIVRLVQ